MTEPHDARQRRTYAEADLPTPAGAVPRRHPIALLTLGVVVAMLGATFAFGLSRDPRALSSPLVGRPAPGFALGRLDGRGILRSSELRGQIVVVNFWASWCTACKEEHSALVAASRRFDDQGVVFVGVVFEDTVSAARAFIRDGGADGFQVIDTAGRTAIDYGVAGVPETFFIDRDGVIFGKRVGASSYRFLSDTIESMIVKGI